MSGVGESTHGIEASQDPDDNEKREERRAKSEKRRERTKERREKTEERREPKRRRQRSPNEAARGPTSGANPFLGHAAGGLDLWRLPFGTAGRGKRAERREKRDERKWPPARFTQDLDGKEKREERREEGEERREKREEKRVPKRGRQRSANEAAGEGPTLFLAMPPGGGTSELEVIQPAKRARAEGKEPR